MNLLNFLRALIKDDGFELLDANNKSYSNILPPLSLLNKKDCQKLIEELKKIDFNYKN